MFEIRKNPDPDSESRPRLFIDGKFEKGVHVIEYKGANHLTFSSSEKDASQRIATFSLSDFPEPTIYIHLWYYPNELEHFDREYGIFIHEENKRSDKAFHTISLRLPETALSEWTAPYSFADYALEIATILDAKGDLHRISFYDGDDEIFFKARQNHNQPLDINEVNRKHIESISISFRYSSPSAKIADEATRISKIVNEAHNEVVSLLLSRIHQGSLVVTVDFPEEVKVPCEQYLLYFVQFLKDIGIEATADIRHEARSVLFSVTPKDKTEALAHIRRALEVYLTLPTNPNLDTSFGLTTEPRTQQLVANIQHLQGQLVLASAAMQLKEATIQQQQLTIQQQRQVTGGVLIESVRIANTPEEDKEKVLGGTVAITKFKWKFLEFDTPDIWRRIKQFVFEQDED